MLAWGLSHFHSWLQKVSVYTLCPLHCDILEVDNTISNAKSYHAIYPYCTVMLSQQTNQILIATQHTLATVLQCTRCGYCRASRSSQYSVLANLRRVRKSIGNSFALLCHTLNVMAFATLDPKSFYIQIAGFALLKAHIFTSIV